MRPRILLIGLLVMALAGAVLAPARAQETFTPQQQAALDDIRAAYEQFLALDSYTAAVTMRLNQDLKLRYLDVTGGMTQKIEAKGTMFLENEPGHRQPNQYLTMSETVSMELSTSSEDTSRSSTSFIMGLIVKDDRVYLRLELPSSAVSVFPQGWHDVTGGAKGYPGLEMINFEGMLKLGTPLSLEFMDAMFAAVREVDILDQEGVEERTLSRYRLTLDPVTVYQRGGLAAVAGIFNEGALQGINVAQLLKLMYLDPDTRVIVEYAIDAADHTLNTYTATQSIDADVSAVLPDGAAPPGTTVILTQTVVQTLQPYAFNQPVDIHVPELAP
jgi:hypothetical protein